MSKSYVCQSGKLVMVISKPKMPNSYVILKNGFPGCQSCHLPFGGEKCPSLYCYSKCVCAPHKVLLAAAGNGLHKNPMAC